ncbi:MAG: PfkB family carbohydrate kinase [Bulleidia sp.]
MKKTYDVTAIGELLIDFTDSGKSQQGNPLLEANPGGAPCNVLSMLSNLGKKTAFIGKVGDDGFGHMLDNAITAQSIDDAGLCYDSIVHTTLALVLKKEDGDRDFSFYRNPGADITLTPDEVRTDLIEHSRIFHFGSLSLTDEPVRSATHLAIETAEKAGCTISFDPNLREPLWKSPDEAKQQIAWGMEHCHYLKISDNEITWFTGKDDYDEGIAYLQEHYPNITLITLSMGPEGSRAYTKDNRVEVPAFLQEGTIETTGAGDTFCACMLKMILDEGLDHLDEQTLKQELRFANAAASIITTRKGALAVMPKESEVLEFLKTR